MFTYITLESYLKMRYEEAKEYAEELTHTTGIDMVKYVDVIKDVDKDTIKNVYHDLLEGIDVEKYIGANSMWNVRKELLTEKYTQDGYNKEQTQTILGYTMLSDIYLTPYITTEFKPEQMREVAFGLKQDVDVTQYNDAKKYTSDEMHSIREDLWRAKRNS